MTFSVQTFSAFQVLTAAQMTQTQANDTALRQLNLDTEVDVASASTCNIGAAAGGIVKITGTTGITAFDTVAAGIVRLVRFAGALTLTYNGTSLILPGGADITTVAGDTAEFVSEGSGNWRCRQYTRTSGLYVKNLKMQSWTTIITNVATVLKHQMYGDTTTGVLGNFIDRITGASITLAVTPTVAVGTDFTSGGGLTGSAFVFNTAAQLAADSVFLGAYLDSTASLLTNPTIQLTHNSRNINGVTRIRYETVFTLATTNAAWNINTTNIPLNAQISWRSGVFLQ